MSYRSMDLAVLMKEHTVENLSELASLAEKYTEAHMGKTGYQWINGNATSGGQHSQQESMLPKSCNKTCFSSGKVGHVSKDYQK